MYPLWKSLIPDKYALHAKSVKPKMRNVKTTALVSAQEMLEAINERIKILRN